MERRLRLDEVAQHHLGTASVAESPVEDAKLVA
jgi:hypothetical protein